MPYIDFSVFYLKVMRFLFKKGHLNLYYATHLSSTDGSLGSKDSKPPAIATIIMWRALLLCGHLAL